VPFSLRFCRRNGWRGGRSYASDTGQEDLQKMSPELKVSVDAGLGSEMAGC
jgi:hypothetical protein